MSEVGIVGYGWVGKSMHELFPDAVVYDEPLGLLISNGDNYSHEKWDHKLDEEMFVKAGRSAINACEVTFVAVPTPNLEKGELDTSVVEEVVEWIGSDVIVLRSTVNPGTADRLKEKTGKHIVSQPEYLGESPKHPLLDQAERPFMILGGEPEDRRRVIETYQSAYNANTSIRQVTNTEAEVIKLSENRAILFKVAQAQELYDACEAADVDYYTIRDAVYGDDPRFNMYWTFIYPNARGANSKCIPKDVYAWAAWAESVGYAPELTNATLERNDKWINTTSV